MFRRPPPRIPTSADVTLSRRHSKANGPYAPVAVFLAIVLAVIWTAGVSLYSNSVIFKEEKQKVDKEQAVVNVVPGQAFRMWPEDRDYMKFSDTLKDCRPQENPKCLEHIPEGTTTQRIGLLRPPGTFGDMFTKFVRNVVYYHWSNTTDLILIPTSHVPPYGYGKTHGYTKIIRLVVSPLMTHGADVMQHAKGNVGIEDLRQVVRQLVRWHCRLSHVAAHTALLTVTLEALVEQAWDTDERIRDFLNLAQKAPLGHLMDDGGLEILDLEASLESVRTLLTKVNNEIPQKQVEDIIHSVIQDELDKTDNLNRWPCLSFWSVGDESNPEALTPFARGVAKAFSPNCTTEYVHCGVARDRCEERGDATCIE